MLKKLVVLIFILLSFLLSNIVTGSEINPQEKAEINKILKCESYMHAVKQINTKQWISVFTNACSSNRYYILVKNKKGDINLIDIFPFYEPIGINIDLINGKGESILFSITYSWESDWLHYSYEVRIYELESNKIIGSVPSYLRPVIKDFDDDREDEIIIYHDVFSLTGGDIVSNWPIVIKIGSHKINLSQSEEYYFLSIGDLVDYPNVIKMHLQDVQKEIGNCYKCSEEKSLNMQKELIQDKLNRALRVEELNRIQD